VDFWLPLAGSLIFVLHPVNVNPWPGIFGAQECPLWPFFLLVLFFILFRYLDGRWKGPSYAGSLGCFSLGLLAQGFCGGPALPPDPL